MVLDRYIGKAVILGCAFSSFVILSVFAFVDYVGQLDQVGTGDYGTLQAMVFVLLQLPQRFYELSPSILLLGGILSLGAMAANSEIIVMRASGVTISRITRSVLQIGLLLAICVAVLGEFVVPTSSRTAKTYRAEALEEKLIVGGVDNIWARDGDRYVNVKEILPDHQLREIRVYEIDKDRSLSSIIYAEKAYYDGNEWVLDNVRHSEISPTGVTAYSEKHLRLKRLILLELFSVLELTSKDMSARELQTYSHYLQKNHLDSNEYQLEFWIKVLTPLTCLAMLLIAMPIVFATTPRSGGAGQRIMLAILIGIIYFVINRSINHLGLALHISPLLSASAPLIVVVTVSLYLMRRVH